MSFSRELNAYRRRTRAAEERAEELAQELEAERAAHRATRRRIVTTARQMIAALAGAGE